MEAIITEDKFIEYMAADFPSFKVTKCNLSYPTSDFVTSFYTRIIEDMTCTNTDLWDFTEEQCAAIERNQNEGSAFVHHIYLRNLHGAVKYIFNQVNQNVHEVSYSDILMPENTPRRTFVLMSFMLNCFYYYINFNQQLHDDMSACEEKDKEIQRKRARKAQLLNQLKEGEDKKKDRVEQLKKVKASLLKYATTNSEKEGILKELHANHAAIDAEVKKVEEREKHYQDELIQIENSIKHYESYIVANPDEAAESLARFEAKKTECKEKMDNLEKLVKDSSDRLSRFNKVMELQQILNNVLMKHDDSSGDLSEDFRELQNSINNLNNKLAAVKATESKYASQLREKESIVQKLKSESSQLESEGMAIKCKGEEKCKKYEENIEKLKKTCAQMTLKIRKDDEIEQINSQIAALSMECANLEKQIKAVDNETKEKYLYCKNEIKNAFDSVQNALISKWFGMES